MKIQNENPPLILASKSPRRRYLLEQAGLKFSVMPSNIDETKIPLSSPETYVRILSEAKADSVSQKYPDKWIIGADTIVLSNGKILGKPQSEDDARIMLEQLSGQTHQVLTGYAIVCRAKNRKFSATVKTDVLFKHLTDKEIQWYIQTKEPFGKAGSYAIQGIGSFLVKSICGSYTNVVGLPVCEVIEFLIKEEIIHMSREYIF
ncbi:MAG: Maf family protein [Desulfobacterales bacterium]|jgi:septum formation protein|nr:Maf family protein [Desulfobacterales bacterium]